MERSAEFWAVWIEEFKNAWRLVCHCSIPEARRLRDHYEANSINCRIHPRHSITVEELIEG